VGNQIIVADSFGTWGTNNLTIDPTALIKIAGQTAGTTLTCNINSVAVTLVYTGATYGWDIFAQIGANDTSVLTQTNTVTGITNKTFVAPVLGAALASTLQATTTIGVGNATPSASGSGITFPATQSASSNANTLDDYEEGTWTPGIAFNNASVGVTYDAANNGFYTKIGREVLITGYLQLSNKGTSAGAATLTGLPFVASNAATYQPLTITPIQYTYTVVASCVVMPSDTILLLQQVSATGGSTNLTDTAFTNGSGAKVNGSYFV
jgi:hypothetical protein